MTGMIPVVNEAALTIDRCSSLDIPSTTEARRRVSPSRRLERARGSCGNSRSDCYRERW